jgi:hypothetical protein
LELIETIYSYLRYNESRFALIALLSVFFWLGSLIVVPWVIIGLPPDYLSRKERLFPHNPKPTFWEYPLLIVKNFFGFIFILAGLAMLVLPGQGLLTLALGLGLINFPGKHRAIQRILGQKRVLKSINRLRARAKKAPLVAPEKPGSLRDTAR